MILGQIDAKKNNKRLLNLTLAEFQHYVSPFKN